MTADYQRIIEFVKKGKNNKIWIKEKTFCTLAEKAIVHTYEEGLKFSYTTKECEWDLYLSIGETENLVFEVGYALIKKIIIKKPYSYCYVVPETNETTNILL